MKNSLALLVAWFSLLLSVFGQSGPDSPEAEIKAAWDRAVESLGGEWDLPAYELLYSEDLDLRKPDRLPKGTEKEWTTVQDQEGRRRYLSLVVKHDGEGGEVRVAHLPDGSKEDPVRCAFDANGVYVSSFGEFEIHQVYDAKGRLVEEKDLDEDFPSTRRYSYDGERLVRIESRDPFDTLFEQFEYDEQGRLMRIKTHLGDGKEVMARTFEYDDQGRVRGMKRIQHGVVLAWDERVYSDTGRRATITHKWIKRRTGLLDGVDITTKDFDSEGTLRRELRERYGPEKSGEPIERTAWTYGEDGRNTGYEVEEAGKPKRVESYERVWSDD